MIDEHQVELLLVQRFPHGARGIYAHQLRLVTRPAQRPAKQQHVFFTVITEISQLHEQKVIVWDNWPKTVTALTGRAVDLPTAARRLVSCPVINQYNAHPVADFWPVLGTAADYAWRPDTYVPADSFARWQKSVPSIVR